MTDTPQRWMPIVSIIDGRTCLRASDTGKWIHIADYTAMKAERDALREALGFYSNPPKGTQVPDFYDELSFGDTASAALAKTGDT